MKVCSPFRINSQYKYKHETEWKMYGIRVKNTLLCYAFLWDRHALHYLTGFHPLMLVIKMQNTWTEINSESLPAYQWQEKEADNEGSIEIL